MFQNGLWVQNESVVYWFCSSVRICCCPGKGMFNPLFFNNSKFTYFLHDSDWMFGRLYTSIKAMRKNAIRMPPFYGTFTQH